MTGESLDVKIARIDEQMKATRESIDLARDSRKQQYEMLEKINLTLMNLDNRVTGVEQSLAATKPTLDEFVDIKLKVQGAGIAGKWAWSIGIAVVSVLYTLREHVFYWFSKL